MLCFLSDYTEGAHPKVLAHLMERNLVSLPGYGEDADTEAAKEKIRRECGRDDLQICFLTGGTQTNRIAISSMLRSYEGVVCCETGHIAVHESGAIESSGHKVIALTANAFDEDVQRSLQAGMNAHLTKPIEPDNLYRALDELIYQAEHRDGSEL